MASSEEDGAAAAAEQLGSVSLGDTEPPANIGAATKLCSACGTESDTAEKCNECECVWYCDKDCKDGHRKEHEKECELIKTVIDQRGGKLDIGTEVDVGPLGKLPPQEECPICMHVLPYDPDLRSYATCCGKTLCLDCDLQHRQHQTTSGERATCAFCREPILTSDEEVLARYRKRAELKDPIALYEMAFNYGYGYYGVPVDHAKFIDLLRESAGLGYSFAHLQLGIYHNCGDIDVVDVGLEQNEEEALKHWKKAAEGGDLMAWRALGVMEHNKGNRDAAMRHWRLAASRGHRKSMECLIENYFEDGLLQHGDLAETLQAFYLARSEMSAWYLAKSRIMNTSLSNT